MKKLLIASLLLLSGIANAQFTDDGNRANEALDSSANWTKVGGSGGSEMQVLSNEFALSNAAGARRLYTAPDQAAADMYVQSSIAGTIISRSSSTSVQIALRAQDADNYIGIGVSSSNNVSCGIRSATTWTEYDAEFDPGGVDVIALKLEAEGTTIRCYYDNGSGFILFHTELGVTTFQAETDGGFISNLNSPNTPVWDDFEIGSLSGGDPFSDDFNRADEALDADANWTRFSAGGQEVNIVSNQLETGTGAGRRAYTSPDLSAPNMYVQADVPTLTGRSSNAQSKIALRIAGNQDYIGAGVSSTNNYDCGKRVANTYTSFYNASPGSTITAIKVEAEGTTIRCYYDTGSGWVLAHTENSVTDHQSETLAGIIDASGASGNPLWDNYENGSIETGGGSGWVDWITPIEDHFDVDFFAEGTTYYFNSDATGSNTGLSNANAFENCSDVHNFSFTAGDQLLFMEDQATTCNARIKNNTMVGDGAGNPFYIGVYHMDGGVETPGFSGGPYSNTPGGRACLDGIDYNTYSYYGGMSQANLQSMLPNVTGNPMSEGTLEGLLSWYQSSDYDLDLYIEDICVRATGGRAFRFTQEGSYQAEWLYFRNVYMEGTMTQAFHISGVYNFIVEDNWVTKTDAEHKYSGSAGNTQACTAFKGTKNDPDREVNGVFRRNVIWDSICSEAIQSNSGGRKILIEDNVIVDAGHVAGIYLDRTHDMVVRRNLLIHTEGRTEFENTTSSNPRGWAGIFVQNESACGSFDWCSTYSTAADFAEYASQDAVIAFNIVAGWRYNYAFQSQASGKSGETHTGREHGACVYFYNNLSLDADERHFTINNPSPVENYVLRTDCPQRVWGNIFYNSSVNGGNGVDVERNDTQFETIFDRNYFSSNISVKSSYDQNITTTGITFPQENYYNYFINYMTMDANQWMDYTNIRAFLTTIGIDPDNLNSKTLTLFKPTSNVASGIALTALTYPPTTSAGGQDNLDIERVPLGSSPYFGPFSNLSAIIDWHSTLLDMESSIGPAKSQTLSGGLDK